MKLVKPQLTFDELVKPLVGNALCLGARYGASSEPVVIYDFQDAQYYGSLVVGTPSEEIKCALRHRLIQSVGAQLRLLRWFSSHNFYRECKSNTYVANGSTFRIEYGSGPVSGFYSKDTVNVGSVSIADYTFAEMTNVSGLGISYSLENLTESAAWLHVPLPCSILWKEGLVDAGAEPVFAFYLENQVNEELAIGGVTSAHYTGDFAYTNLESTSLLAS